jgi:hypothetical protein
MSAKKKAKYILDMQKWVKQFTDAKTVIGDVNVHTKSRVRRKVQKPKNKPQERIGANI